MAYTRFFLLPAVILCTFVAALNAEETGRTDGPEEGEYGKGGYPFGGPAGRFYISPTFGSGVFDTPGLRNQTGLLYGIRMGYEMEEWLGIQGGFDYLSDRKMSIFSLGSRFAYPWHPFVYYASVSAGLYSPESGDRHFGIAPGAGIDIVIHDRVRVGLEYKHDLIFSDDRSHMDRVFAGLRLSF